MRTAAIVGVGILVLGALPAMAAEPTPTEDSDAFPITVEVTPARVYIATRGKSKAVRNVLISGQTLPAGNRPVEISVSSDDVPTRAMSVTPDESGAYSYGSFGPLEAGEYTITVTAPDGRGQAETELKAVDTPDLEEESDELVPRVVKITEAALVEAETALGKLSSSPAKDESLAKLTRARAAAKQLAAATPAAAQHLRGVFGAIGSDPELQVRAEGGLNSIAGTMGRLAAQADEVERMRGQLTGAYLGCHQLAVATEVFKAIGTLLSIKTSLFEQTIGLAKDITSDAASNKVKPAAGDVGGFAAGQVIKNAEAIGDYPKLVDNAYSIMADLAAFVTETTFNAFCEQFQGPIDAVFAAEFFRPVAGVRTPWWSYHYRITGRLILYYPKSAAGNSVRLKGRIEGYAHSFETWEDALTVTFPKLMAGAQQIKQNFPPVELGAGVAKGASQGTAPLSPQIWGSAAGQLAPNSFLIDADGLLEDDTLVLNVGEAISDFNATHRVTVLILSPLTGGLGPQITWYPLSFLGAHHVFARGSNDEPIRMPLKRDNKVMTAEHTIINERDKPNSHGSYRIKIKACNPACL